MRFGVVQDQTWSDFSIALDLSIPVPKCRWYWISQHRRTLCNLSKITLAIVDQRPALPSSVIIQDLEAGRKHGKLFTIDFEKSSIIHPYAKHVHKVWTVRRVRRTTGLLPSRGLL